MDPKSIKLKLLYSGIPVYPHLYHSLFDSSGMYLNVYYPKMIDDAWLWSTF